MQLAFAEVAEGRTVELIEEDGRFFVLTKSPEMVSSCGCGDEVSARGTFEHEVRWQQMRRDRGTLAGGK